jgi:hypothetical protein
MIRISIGKDETPRLSFVFQLLWADPWGVASCGKTPGWESQVSQQE